MKVRQKSCIRGTTRVRSPYFAIEGVRNQLRALSGPAAPRRIRDRPEPRRNAANQRQAADRPENPLGAAHRRGGTCKTGAGHSARRRHVSTTRGAFTLTREPGGLFPCTRPHCHLGPRQHGGRRYARAVFLEVPARSSGADPARFPRRGSAVPGRLAGLRAYRGASFRTATGPTPYWSPSRKRSRCRVSWSSSGRS
jgi:hypothetical protein